MASTTSIAEGLKILARYHPDGMDAQIGGAERDILFGPAGVDDVTEDDKRALDRLGWHLDSGTSGWARFV